MFHGVIPALSQASFVIAPDLPGFGESEPMAEPSFTGFGAVISELLDRLATGPRFIYLHDFGAPVGFHIAMQAPAKVLGLVVQNANAHRSGFGPQWAATRTFWAQPTARNEAAATSHLTFEGTRDQYLSGVPPDVAARISPGTWEEDWRVMNQPGRMATQRALVRDYGRYVDRFDAIAAYLAQSQPPALMLWGRHDAFFDLAEVQSWMQDLPRMEAHIFDAGHMLLETHAAAVLPPLLGFIERIQEQP
jgi:pimeloyl-ACP methyl ester carboxylesterase